MNRPGKTNIFHFLYRFWPPEQYLQQHFLSRSLCSCLDMPGSPVDEGHLSPEKKTGSARTSKKSKRRKAIRFVDWSGQQESVNSHRTGVQQQSQAVEDGHGATAGETIAPKVSASTPDLPPLPDPQIQNTSPSSGATNPFPDTQTQNTSPGNFAIKRFLLDDQTPDPPPPALHSSPMSEQTHGVHENQLAQEEQKADDWPSENLRPNAQNLRYGGYPTQPAPQNRNTPLGSGRLQNTTKLGAFGYFASSVVQWNANVS